MIGSQLFIKSEKNIKSNQSPTYTLETFFTLFILTIAAAETSIGLAILVLYYRLKGTIGIEHANFLKG